ncbi:transcription factor MafA-like [Montipora foliosa]|uniref:transcription factor MafA-like n=1 Tax=Montipora foliosa TaxID=591990 RepID=UPI0035F16CA6
MAAGDGMFSIENRLSLASPSIPSSSLLFDNSVTLFNEVSIRGSEIPIEFDDPIHNSQSSIESGSKSKKKVASKRSQKTYKTFNSELLLGLSDKELEKMTMKELNNCIKGIPKLQAQKIKKRRRILKNRKYAFKCRLRCHEKKTKMSEENASLEREVSATKAKLQRILNQRDYYKSKYLQLRKHLESASSREQPEPV